MNKALSRHLAVEEYQSNVTRKRLILLGFLALVAFLTWSAMTTVHETVSGAGSVQPMGRTIDVQHIEGGTVRQMLKSEGDSVRVGETILQLDTGEITSELARLSSRRSAIDYEIQRDLIRASVERGSVQLDGNSQLLESQQAALETELGYIASRLSVLDSEILLAQAQRDSLQAGRRSLEQEQVIVRQAYEDYDRAYNSTGAVTRKARDEARLKLIRLEGELAAIIARIAEAEILIKKIKHTRDEFLSEQRREALSRAAELEAQKSEVNEKISRLRTLLLRSEITAPTSGTIQSLSVSTPSQVIAPGEVIAKIVPAGQRLIGEVEVPASQVGRLRVGMSATVKVLTYDFARFGGLVGTIESISPTSELNESGEMVFGIQIRFSTDRVGLGNAGGQVQPGYSITADFETGQKTVLGYLLRPLRVLADRAMSEA